MKKPVKLNIGCGVRMVSGFINVDKTYTEKQIRSKKGTFRNSVVEPNSKYVQGDVLNLPFKDNYADYIESIDMIEHIPLRGTLTAIKEMRRVLKPGGTLKIMTTNFDNLATLWTELITGKELDFSDPQCPFYDLVEVIYGNQAAKGEFHCAAFNPQYSKALFKYAGFDNITITIFPKGTTNQAPVETQYWKEDSVWRTEMMLITAVK